MHRIIARRLGRIAFGVVLVIGTSMLVQRAFTGGHLFRDAEERLGLEMALVVAGAWLGAFVAGGLVWLIARAVLARRAPAKPGALFAASLSVPMVGIVLLLPISIHLAFYALMGEVYSYPEWVKLSVFITVAPHLALAALCAVRGHRLAHGRPAMSPVRIYAITVIVSSVPFVVVILPPVLVALTALPFLPLLGAMEALASRERAELSSIPELPRAIALLPPAV